MGKPAARMGDSTVHGGAITAGAPTVLIGGMPAARVSDMHACPMLNPGTPPPPHVGGPVMLGSPTVLICGQMAARVGDMAQCQGPPDSIAMGCMTVLIGEMSAGGGGAGAGGSAAAGDTGGQADDPEAATPPGSGASPVGPATASAVKAVEGQELGEDEDHFLDVRFVDKGGAPITNARFKLTSPDKRETVGLLQGRIRKTGVKPGSYQIDVRKITKAAWSQDEAREDDAVKLQAEAVGFPEGAPAKFRIYRRDINTADKLVAESEEMKLQGGRVETGWQYDHPEDMELVDPAAGEGYSSPRFYFKVEIDGETQRSGVLDYRDWAEIEVTDESGEGLGDAEYILYLANGEIRKGKLDGAGKAKEEDVPPGPCSLFLPDHENIEPEIADDADDES